MLPEYGYILAAGKGSRMGPIGTVLPKILWPIYGKTILELQVDYLKSLGCQKIVINLHHQADIISSFIKKNHIDLEFLIEKELLGSGGCFHHFKKHYPDVQHVLCMNGDQFLFPLLKIKNLLESSNPQVTASLLAMPFDPNIFQYNRLHIARERLINIEKPPSELPPLTYPGIGVINLSNLQPRTGVSSFFDTVANYLTDHIQILPLQSCDYWDFGKRDLYYHNIKNIHQFESNPMSSFLQEHHAFNQNQIVMKFFGEFLSLDGITSHPSKAPGIGYNGIIDLF